MSSPPSSPSSPASRLASPSERLAAAAFERNVGGRAKDDVWDHFDRSTQGKGFKATCKFCGTIRQGKVLFLYRHLSLCESCPADVQATAQTVLKRKLEEADGAKQSSSAAAESPAQELPVKSSQPSPALSHAAAEVSHLLHHPSHCLRKGKTRQITGFRLKQELRP